MGKRLAYAREAAGFRNAREAAEALDIKYPTYAGHENGSRNFKTKTAEKYARRFKVPVAWIMFGTGETPRVPSENEAQARTAIPVDAIKKAAKRLTILRLSMGHADIESFAGVTGVSPDSLVTAESGDELLSIFDAMKISYAMEVTLDWLYLGKTKALAPGIQHILSETLTDEQSEELAS